jgi:L,D-transpeptidase YnhG
MESCIVTSFLTGNKSTQLNQLHQSVSFKYSVISAFYLVFITVLLVLLIQPVFAAGLPTQAISQDPETRLIEVQKLLAEGRLNLAKDKAEGLIRDVPNFRAAHLIYGDILNAKNSPITTVGDVPILMSQNASHSLQGLRAEAKARLVGVKYLPPPNTVPSQLLNLSSFSRHAIVVDASKSRLYFFENDGKTVKLLHHFYTSIGKLGIGKVDEGDQRTPLGVYYISRTIAQDKLPTKYGPGYYGSGALTLTYPNPLDLRRGKTGSGIWIHGTPPTEFARFPKASDGCVVLANPDFEKVNKIINPKTTPVIITEAINWVNPSLLEPERRLFSDTVQLWLAAKSNNQFDKLVWFYDANFFNGKGLSDWKIALKEEQAKQLGKSVAITDVSFLRWQDKDDIMVLTYTENSSFRKMPIIKRLYWIRVASQWKIFYEGVIG